ncbi:putative hydrolase [Helianthus annuus]|nr:putative hydrolase [Helianthus annuus]
MIFNFFFFVLQWMPLEEYAALPYVKKESLMWYTSELCKAKVDKGYSGFSPQPVTSFFSDKPSHIYLNKRDLN